MADQYFGLPLMRIQVLDAFIYFYYRKTGRELTVDRNRKDP